MFLERIRTIINTLFLTVYNYLKNINDAYYQKSIELILISLSYPAIFLVYFMYWEYGLPHVDAGYYLSITNYLADGLKLFKDINVSYTALTFYLILPFKYLFGYHFNYKTALCIIYTIQIINAYLIYQIGISQNLRKNVAHIVSLVFLILSLLYGSGELYCLEPFVNLFGLLSIFVLLKGKPKIFIGGIFAALAYFSKQYGIGYTGLSLFIIIFSSRSFTLITAKQLLLFLCGWTMIFVIYHGYFFSQNGNFNSVFLSGSNNYEVQSGIKYMLLKLLNYTKEFPWVFTSALIFYNLNRNHQLLLVLSLFGFIGFGLQFYFRPYPHYAQLLLPFICFILMINLNKLTVKQNILFYLLILFYISQAFNGAYLTNKRPPNKELVKFEKVAKATITDKIDVFILPDFESCATPYLYFALDLKPPLLNVRNLSGFGFETDKEKLLKCKSAKSIIADSKTIESLKKNVDSISIQITKILEQKEPREFYPGYYILKEKERN